MWVEFRLSWGDMLRGKREERENGSCGLYMPKHHEAGGHQQLTYSDWRDKLEWWRHHQIIFMPWHSINNQKGYRRKEEPENAKILRTIHVLKSYPNKYHNNASVPKS